MKLNMGKKKFTPNIDEANKCAALETAESRYLAPSVVKNLPFFMFFSLRICDSRTHTWKILGAVRPARALHLRELSPGSGAAPESLSDGHS